MVLVNLYYLLICEVAVDNKSSIIAGTLLVVFLVKITIEKVAKKKSVQTGPLNPIVIISQNGK